MSSSSASAINGSRTDCSIVIVSVCLDFAAPRDVFLLVLLGRGLSIEFVLLCSAIILDHAAAASRDVSSSRLFRTLFLVSVNALFPR